MAIGLPASDEQAPVTIVNPAGAGPFVLLCDHASNRMPSAYGGLGLSAEDRSAHIAWDPGALGVSIELSRLLDAPLVHSTISRLIIDCNRDQSARDLIPEISERTQIPGNQNLSNLERGHRIAMAHRPFHDAIDDVIDRRVRNGDQSVLVSIHTYTPVHMGVTRPWEIGLLSNKDRRLVDPSLEFLRKNTKYLIGDNEPYSPSDGVYYTLERHGERRGFMCLMVEIRNDEVATPDAEKKWAALLADTLKAGLANAAEAGAGGSDA